MIMSIIVGIATGIISSWIVTISFQHETDKKIFKTEIINFSSYLKHLFDELRLAEDSQDFSKIIWLLACKPQGIELQRINSDSIKLMSEIDLFFEEIYEFCFACTQQLSLDDRDKKQLIYFQNKAIEYSEKIKNIKLLRRGKRNE